MTETKTVRNEPNLLVAVWFVRKVKTYFPPHAGKTFHMPVSFVGASAREVSFELSAARQREHPVVWRFIRGESTGGDDPRTDPPWVEHRVEFPSKVRDARNVLEKALAGVGEDQQFRWFVMSPERGDSTR